MEGGICTPLVAYWPAVIKNKGSINRRPIHFIDFLATFIDITGAEYPKKIRDQDIVPLQGESFLTALKGKDQTRNRPLFWDWRDGAVREGDWKLVSQKKAWALYNLAEDRSEITDLSEKYPEKVKELKTLYNQWAKEVGAKVRK